MADQELLVQAGEKASVDLCHTKIELLNSETASFIHGLYFQFESLVHLFNERVKNPELHIKLSRTVGGLDGFSLNRNGMRLSVSTGNVGSIQLQCEKLVTEVATKLTKTSLMFSGLVEAKFGTFHDLEWFFLGSRILPEQLARHYLTEFIQVSRAGV